MVIRNSYQTSLDDLKNVVTPDGLEGGYESEVF